MSIISKVVYCTMISAGGVLEKKFNKYTLNSRSVNEEVLFKILNKNNECNYGEKYNFNSIRSVNEYKEIVPITDYSDYEQYINEMLKGKKNILITDDVEYFGHTSGTTGKQKLIPVTKKSREVGSKYMALLIERFAYNNLKNQWNYGRGLMLADTVMTTYSEGGVPICSATSGGMDAIKFILPKIYTSPYEVMKIKDKNTALYLHLLFALNDKNLTYISGVFISNVLDALRVLEEKSELLVMDIKKGRINRNLNIGDENRKKLNKYLKPNAGRADEIELEFSKGFRGICRRLWPKITYIAAVTGANFSIYDEMVNYYTESLPIYSPAYAATEAMIGINPYISNIRYVIIPDTVFYEFIPIDESDKEKPMTCCIDELKIGEKYEIIVTNYAGFYRYRLGDVIKVVGYYNNSPEVEFLYRKNQVLNMVSEKTTEDHLKVSINKTIKELGVSLIDYTTIADNTITPGRYIFYFELDKEISQSKIKNFEKILDLELQKANLAYSRFRKNNKLSGVSVNIVRKNTFDNIKKFLISNGVSKSQIKIPRVATNKTDILRILNDNRI
ncbi:GH3 auxin-responsive promoter family protein [Clostridium celatum]|uniref:GH3 auxin-responsive promoter family protein n=1 Tax=Clostridium celatum TaxID=36834 RepID=UPI00189AF400|nr:GH3 auxin-responsive promoter family protein [Clostridium celatum]